MVRALFVGKQGKLALLKFNTEVYLLMVKDNRVTAH